MCGNALSFSMSKVAAGSRRVVLLTGATDGIGRHTAKKLAADGEHLLLVHGRDPSRGAALLRELEAAGAPDSIYFNADLSDADAVARLAEEVAARTDRLDVLINNAGVFDPPQRRTPQGFDTSWAVNVLAPFALTHALLPLVLAGGSVGRPPRVITTSSISQASTLDFDNMNAEKGFSAHTAYSLSKTATHMFTAGLARKLGPRAQCLTMDPGTVNTKMLLAGWGSCGIPVDAAHNTYTLATDPSIEGTGRYFYGGAGTADARDPAKLARFFAALEHQTGCAYSQSY